MVEWLLTDNYRFKHPNVWIMYTLVYTMLNLVVGILYAFWRLILLVVFSLSRFNRLDRSLFPTWQSLDQVRGSMIEPALPPHFGPASLGGLGNCFCVFFHPIPVLRTSSQSISYFAIALHDCGYTTSNLDFWNDFCDFQFLQTSSSPM